MRRALVVVLTAAAAVLLSAGALRSDRDVAVAAPTGLTVTALGDSVPAGSRCDCAPFPVRYGRLLTAARHEPVTVHNDAVKGWDSHDLFRALAPGSARASDVASSDVVLVMIGANDFSDRHDRVLAGSCHVARSDSCVAGELAALQRRLGAIRERTLQERAGRATTVVFLGYWNVFEDGDAAVDLYPPAGLRAARALTWRVNDVIEQAASGLPYVDLRTVFRHGRTTHQLTRLLAADGDHLSAAGASLTARAVLAVTG